MGTDGVHQGRVLFPFHCVFVFMNRTSGYPAAKVEEVLFGTYFRKEGKKGIKMIAII